MRRNYSFNPASYPLSQFTTQFSRYPVISTAFQYSFLKVKLYTRLIRFGLVIVMLCAELILEYTWIPLDLEIKFIRFNILFGIILMEQILNQTQDIHFLLTQAGLSTFAYRFGSFLAHFLIYSILFTIFVILGISQSKWNGSMQWTLFLLIPLHLANCILFSYILSLIFKDPIIAMQFADFYLSFIFVLLSQVSPYISYLIPYLHGCHTLADLIENQLTPHQMLLSTMVLGCWVLIDILILYLIQGTKCKQLINLRNSSYLSTLDNHKCVLNFRSLQIQKKQAILIYGQSETGKSKFIESLIYKAGKKCGPKTEKLKLYGRQFKVDQINNVFGFLSQKSIVFEGLNLKEILYFIGICKGLSEESTLCQITYLCNLFELTSYFKFCIRSLSPGTLRKVNLVVALMGPPRILILDDPFRDVDPYVTRVISKCLRNYVYSKNMAVIMACRNLSKRLFPNARRYHIHSLTP